ncbi:hypothetical protein A2V68_02345 [candidate division Kazan bacterium RBG_13_50_9]|uniref:NYN domain-containing protein n=1 Tax=candidate division Kazan bacterium RBG_13_50_9 TaxID=1798535 RepID=A0A1F4NRZ8_UNCK3|nr:MAG: hypothetical protein A2V68_02345 [candidate division Kazan bacterium RBG_13_50_9]
MSSQYSEQRVGVFVDVANLYHSARVMYNRKVNFRAVIKEAVGDRKLIRAIAYVIKAESPEEQKFFDALDKIGFEVKSKELQVFYGGHKKGDWDVGIAMDAIRLAPKIDVVVLVSGDGDFVPLLEHLKSIGQRTEVIAFGRSASGRLRDLADNFIDLDSNVRKFLLADRKSSNG